MRSRRPLLLASLAVLLAAGGGLAPRVAADPEPTKGAPATFTWFDSGFDSIDPAMTATPLEERLALACFEPLTTIDPQTGKVRPGAAESWTESPDGRTWTFKLRASSHWTKKFGDTWEDKGPVTAGDFVWSWKRVLDPETKSPNASVLDAIPGCLAYRADGRRGTNIDAVAAALFALAGDGKKSVRGEDVVNFLENDDSKPKWWLSSCDAPAIQRLLAWNSKDPLVPAKLKEMKAALDEAAKTCRTGYEEATKHVGVDRGFYAKDDSTFVVEVPGPSPWLPSLLSRAVLAPVFEKTVDRSRELAFQNYNFVSNGAYVLTGELPPSRREGSTRGSFKVVLTRSPKYWNAAAVPAEVVTCLVDHDLDDIATEFGRTASWAPVEAFGDDARTFREARVPGWKPKPNQRAAERLPALLADVYDIDAGGTLLLWFQCRKPFDKADVRRALVSLLDRAALEKAAGLPGAPPPLSNRIVPPRTSGVSGTLAVPSFDRAKAAELYGGKKLLDGTWISVLFRGEDAAVGDAVVKAWLSLKIDDVTAYSSAPDEFASKLVTGGWHAAIAPWTPDFDDPLSVLAAFGAGGQAGTGWVDARFDALLKAARDVTGWGGKDLDKTLSDLADAHASLKGTPSADVVETARRRLLLEAEKRLLDEAVVVPLWPSVESGLVKKNVRGLTGLGAWAGSGRNVLDVHPVVGATAGS